MKNTEKNIISERFEVNNNKSYNVPFDVKSTAQKAVNSNFQTSDGGNEGSGKRKAQELASGKPQSHAQMKRLKAFFDANQPGSAEWELHGGDAAKRWVDFELKTNHDDNMRSKEHMRRAGGAGYEGNEGMGSMSSSIGGINNTRNHSVWTRAKNRNVNEEKVRKIIRNSLLKEFITREEVYLKDYFSMSKEARKEYLPYEYYYFFRDFLIEEDVDFEDPKEIVPSNYADEPDEEEDMFDSDLELITWLQNEKKEIYYKFADYLYKKIINYELDISDSDYPAWFFFDDDPEIIKNQWLIHFSDNAESIAEEGFKYGVDEMEKLGLTTHLSEFDKKYGGYNFAYTLQDFKRYARKVSKGYSYGREAVVFRASGIRLYHNSDHEYQTIFYGNTARDIVLISEGYSADWAVTKKDGTIIFENGSFERVVKWVIQNYAQYKNILKENVLSESRENFVAYHGSESVIKKFSDNFVGKEDATDQEGAGIYFTTDYKEAKRYGNYIYKVSIEGNFLFNNKSKNNINLQELVKLIKMKDQWEMDAQNYSPNPEQGALKAASMSMKYNDSEVEVFQQIEADFYRYDPVNYVRNMTKLGYDGIVVDREEGQHIIVFNPSVIKISK